MEKILVTALTTAMIISITACGGSGSSYGTSISEKQNDTVNKQTETVEEKEAMVEADEEIASVEEQTPESTSDKVNANGITVQVVGIHKTKDSNGETIAAVEFLFTNDNAEPISLMRTASITAFQNGVRLHKDEMFLEKDYDWDTYYTEIKDGATISVFRAIPLHSETAPVELTVKIINPNNGASLQSTTVKMELTN